MDANVLAGTSGGLTLARFPTPTILRPNVNYRVTVLPTTTTANTWVRYQANSVAIMEAMPGGASWYGTSRVDAGAWTDVTTDYLQIGILVNGIDMGISKAKVVNQ
jgi:hypothetical protein